MDSGSRSAGTATNICVAPTSIPAALGSITGNCATLFLLRGMNFSLSALRLPGPCRKVVSQTRSSSLRLKRFCHHCIEHGARNHTGGRACRAPLSPRSLLRARGATRVPESRKSRGLFLASLPRRIVWYTTGGDQPDRGIAGRNSSRRWGESVDPPGAFSGSSLNIGGRRCSARVWF